MNSPKITAAPVDPTVHPPRLESLLSLLIASPMALLGCPGDDGPAQPEEGSTGTTGTSTGPGPTTVADSGTTSTTGAMDDTTSGSSGSSSGTTVGMADSTSSGGSSGSTGSSGESSSEGSSSSSGGGGGNICYHAGQVMEMCLYAGAGGYYEYACNYLINLYIATGDIPCAQAHAEIYACLAGLDCAAVAMGWYNVCAAQHENMYDTCYGGSDTDTFGFETEFGSFTGATTDITTGVFPTGGFTTGFSDTGDFTTGFSDTGPITTFAPGTDTDGGAETFGGT